MEQYLVGGAVRDRLLGIPVYDRDWVVVGSTPENMLAKGFEQVGKDFPVFLHPQTKEEYALARKERKQGVGYHGFAVEFDESVSLEEDLVRRDLTINAIAQDDNGRLIDPYGGQKDIENRVLRHVSDAFVEDPLRVLRVARFAAKLAPFGFELAPETQALLSDMALSGELIELTPERVWQELVKVLNSDAPSRFFTCLHSVNALSVLFPEIAQLEGVTQPEKWHPEGDVLTHTLMVLDASTQLSTELSVRFAALVHDLGKGLTPPELWPKHHGHEQAGVALVKAMCQRFKVPKKIQVLAEQVTEFHGLVHKGVNAEGKTEFKPKTFLKVIRGCGGLKDLQHFKNVLLACEADAKGRTGFERVDYPQAAFWMRMAESIYQVETQPLIQQGFSDKALGEQIEKVRLQRIQAAI